FEKGNAEERLGWDVASLRLGPQFVEVKRHAGPRGRRDVRITPPRPQPIDATVRPNTSDGFIQSRVCLGRLLSSRATALRWAAVCRVRSAVLGKYCRNRPFVFSLLPRCHGLWGLQKET